MTRLPAAHPACAECGERHGPALRCDGAMNYEWHIIPAHRISKRARDKQERQRRAAR